MQLTMGGGPPQDTLPALREDLELSRSGMTGAGAPTYTIHDPVAGKYYRIGWLQFEILSHWQAGQAPEAVLRALRQRPFLQVDEEDVTSMASFLQRHHLVATGEKETAQMTQTLRSRKSSLLQFGLKNYLYLKVPLVRPDRLLTWLEPRLRFMFGAGFLWGILALAALGALLIAQDWVRWFGDFAIIKTPGGAALTFCVLLFAKIVHEFGHGLAAKHYGCRVPRMGVALILLWPVLWTDTTDAWRISDNRKRLVIDGAGVIAELALAALATVLWVLAPDGVIKTALHLLSGVTWIMTLAVNVNPFMRFDGYYLLADGVDIPNLQERAFAHTRWWLRRNILWSDEAEPEHWPPRTAWFLRAYAISCWIYRVILFTGIALLVYAYFFKLLGIVLFLIEIWVFLLKPVWGEVKNWRAQLSKSHVSPVFLALGVFLGFCLLLSALPVWRTVSVTGYARAPAEYLLETPMSAQLQGFALLNGQKVRHGETLAVFDSPDITYKSTLSIAQAATLERQYRQSSLNAATYQKGELLGGQAMTKRAEAASYRASRDNLTLVAQVDGVIRDVPSDVRAGDWLEGREKLGILVSSGAVIQLFVPEAQLIRLEEGQKAVVISGSDPQLLDEAFIVSKVGATPVEVLPYPELSAENQGPVAMRPSRRGQPPGPSDQLFPVTLVQARINGDMPLQLAQSGLVDVQIRANAHSPMMEFLRKAASVLIRETGF